MDKKETTEYSSVKIKIKLKDVNTQAVYIRKNTIGLNTGYILIGGSYL